MNICPECGHMETDCECANLTGPDLCDVYDLFRLIDNKPPQDAVDEKLEDLKDKLWRRTLH